MTRINVRTKGAVGEREAAAILQKVVDEVFTSCGHEPPKLRRNVEQAQVGGEDLVGLPWYSFEIKRVERIDLDKWWQQTLTQAARKPPLASMALAQRFGGWKSLAADGLGSGASGEAVGSVPGAGCGAAGALRVEVGSAGSHDAAVGHAMGQGLGVDRPAWAGGQGTKVGQGTIEQCSLVGGSVAPSQVMPLPLWARSSGLELVPSANGGSRDVERLVLVGKPIVGVVASDGRLKTDGNPVSSPLAGGSPLVATLDASKGPNAEKPLPMAREAVLIWRQNSRPWNVRFLGTLVSHNGAKLATVLDASLESWLKLFREDLRARVLV